MEENNLQSSNSSVPISGMFKEWFLDYASYVILERAVPAIEDGMKPVQRRIFHAMKELDDGRFNKVANIIGSTMQYHPHGDASIGDAIVNLGQKELLIDTQGNWGDIRTGDSAAAARYIEARLSPLAKETVFNKELTNWQLSYDGRKNEPLTLPVKIPLLLMQGAEGIAVGLSTKILPHNFIELLQSAIAHLRNETFTIYPDFQTGGMIDVSAYNDGARGGKVRIRATLEEKDSKTILIKDVPYGVSVGSIIESIEKANESGKIKIKKIIDNTGRDVEIEVQLAPGQNTDMAISALYAFTNCEVSVSPNACVIVQDKPTFLSVSEILRFNTERTVQLLRKEQENKKLDLQEKILFSSLEKIFIENKIYRDIEECQTWEAVIAAIDKGLTPYKASFYRTITDEDIVRLTEIKIKRISKFDGFKADELMRSLEQELKQVNHNLAHIVDFTISFFEQLLVKFGKGRERKTEIRVFDTIAAAQVAANNQKLYVNYAEGFIGYGMKKDEFVCDCFDLDDILVFLKDGTFQVVPISEKTYVGKNIMHVEVFNKNDLRKVFHLIYLDASSESVRVKRFQVAAITRNRVYELTTGHKNNKVLYFSVNPNAESETVTIYLSNGCKAKKKIYDFDFAAIEIKGRSAQGNILTKHPVRRIQFKAKGNSTLGGLKTWFNPQTGLLNREEKGEYIGELLAEDLLLCVYQDGSYEQIKADLHKRFDTATLSGVYKFDPQCPLTVLYREGNTKTLYLKRFLIETSTLDKRFNFLSESAGTQLLGAYFKSGHVQVSVKAKGSIDAQVFDLDLLAEIKNMRILGYKFPVQHLEHVALLDAAEDVLPLPLDFSDQDE